MIKLTGVIAGATFMVGLMVSTALATPVDANSLALTALQGVLTNTLHSSINAKTDETKAETFSFQGQTADSFMVSVTTSATLGAPLQFGLYDIYDTSKRLLLFSAPPDLASTNTAIRVRYNATSNTVKSFRENDDFEETPVDRETFKTNAFGTYLTMGSQTYYSQSSLNPGGEDHFLSYLGKPQDQITLPGITTTRFNDLGHLYIAGEASASGTGYDDVLIRLESVSSVPEPGSMVLLGAGFLGLAIYGKRRQNA